MPADCSDRITVVVLTHNRPSELCRSLDRLIALPERPPIIVVDNASTDDTVVRVMARFPSVTVVSTADNLGAAGRNAGAKLVATPYVAFSDDDTWWAPGSLQEAVRILDEHPRVMVLNASILVGPEEVPDDACIPMASSPLEPLGGVGPMLIGFMAGAVVMRTEAFTRAGGYWPPFFIGGEETLLALDILDAGGDIVYAPALRVHHWPSAARDSGLRRRLLARNAVWAAWMRLPAAMAWHQTKKALSGVADRAKRLQVITDVLRGFGPVLRNRRVVGRRTQELLQQVWRHEAR